MPWYTVSAAGVLSLNGLSGAVTLAVVGGSIAAADNTITITVTPGVTSWAALTGKPTTFPPSAHSHAIADVSGLQTALDEKQAAGSYAAASHTHTAGQVSGLATVATSGSAGDLTGTLSDARLSANVPILVAGVIPSAYLPSFVDDVLEAATLSAFPVTGETGKIYVARDTNRTYRWSGSTYVEISASPGSTDAVSEGSVNLYFTTARASAAAPVQSVAGRSGAVVLAKADVGLGSVDNTADASKPVSTAQAAADAAVQAYAIQRANHTGTQAVGTITGLGGAATLSVGTTAGTVAAGDDSRITGALSTATASTTYQPLDADLTSIAALTTTTFGRSLLTQADASAARTTIGLGSLATQSGTFSGTSIGTNTGDQTFTLTGDVTGSGTGSFAATLSASGVTAGTYASVTVDAKGRVTSATATQAWSTITATPTTLTGYGITDAATSTHVHGNLTNAGAIGSTSGQIVVTTASGVLTTAATISASAISGLATVATSGSGSDITSGTVAAARLGTHASTHQTGGTDAVAAVVVSPTALSASTNNWSIGTGDVFRVSASAAYDLTGITAGTSGLAILLINVGSYAITLKHQSASSTAANRFTTPWAGDCILAASGGNAVLVYDSTTATWRVL